nr:MAG TPA: hypothetical protein [Caudoviricetes sp.]
MPRENIISITWKSSCIGKVIVLIIYKLGYYLCSKMH